MKNLKPWGAASDGTTTVALFGFDPRITRIFTNSVERVAERLGNTPSVCRKCYVHPAVIDAYLDGTMRDSLRQRAERELAESLHELRPEEAAVMALLRQRLVREGAQERVVG